MIASKYGSVSSNSYAKPYNPSGGYSGAEETYTKKETTKKSSSKAKPKEEEVKEEAEDTDYKKKTKKKKPMKATEAAPVPKVIPTAELVNFLDMDEPQGAKPKEQGFNLLDAGIKMPSSGAPACNIIKSNFCRDNARLCSRNCLVKSSR
jgi:hypothetical protein